MNASFLLFNQAFASFTGTEALRGLKTGGSKIGGASVWAGGIGFALVGGAVPEAFPYILGVSSMDMLLVNNYEITATPKPITNS